MQVKGEHPLAVEINIAVIQVPFVRPQQVVPCSKGAAHHKADVVHVVVIVHINVHIGWHRTVCVHPVHSVLQQGELAIPSDIVCRISVGVGCRIIGHVIVARMAVLIGEDGVAARRRVVLCNDAQVMIAGVPKVIEHRHGTGGAVVEHCIYRAERSGCTRGLVAETDKDDHIVHRTVVGTRCLGCWREVFLRHSPGIVHAFQVLGVGYQVRGQTCRPGIVAAGHKGCRHQLAVGKRCIHILTRHGVLHNRESVGIVQPVKEFVARHKTMQSIAIRLDNSHWHKPYRSSHCCCGHRHEKNHR